MLPARSNAGIKKGIKPRLIAAGLAAAASLLSACAGPTGDFGRPKASTPLFGDVQDRIAEISGNPPRPIIGQTAAEDELIHRLAHFRQLPLRLPPDASARANAISDRISVDLDLSERIAVLRPALADKARIRAGAKAAFGQAHPAASAMGDERNLRTRALLWEHCLRLRHRTASNRTVLEELVLAAPEIEVIATERRLLELEARVPVICAGLGGEGEATSERPAAPGTTARPLVLKY